MARQQARTVRFLAIDHLANSGGLFQRHVPRFTIRLTELGRLSEVREKEHESQPSVCCPSYS